MSARIRRAALLLAAASLVAACSGDPTPPDDLLDGNVIVGQDPDAGARDTGVRVRDAGFRDGGPAPRDGGAVDGGERDGGTRDAGAPDAGDQCEVTPVATLTAAEAVAEAAARDGLVVEVVGTATRTPYRCTDLPCPEDDPCCNRCVADILVDGVLLVASDACFGAVAQCAGTECAQVCQPALLGVPDRFIGRLVDDDTPRLELFDVIRP